MDSSLVPGRRRAARSAPTPHAHFQLSVESVTEMSRRQLRQPQSDSSRTEVSLCLGVGTDGKGRDYRSGDKIVPPGESPDSPAGL